MRPAVESSESLVIEPCALKFWGPEGHEHNVAQRQSITELSTCLVHHQMDFMHMDPTKCFMTFLFESHLDKVSHCVCIFPFDWYQALCVHTADFGLEQALKG